VKHLTPLFDSSKPSIYTSIAGITNAVFPQYTDASRHIYDQLLKIFNKFDLEYYLFAGSIVGYVRNKEMPKWMDDLDIIVFDDQKPLFEQKIVPYLRECGFNTFVPRKWEKGGYHILSLQIGNTRNLTIPFSRDLSVAVPWAQVDVFFTSVDENRFIRNLSGWGLYHHKDIPVEWVKPGIMIDIEGLTVRVFSEYEKDIKKEYGDVFNNVVVASHGKKIFKLNSVSWGEVEKEFEDICSREVQELPLLIQSKHVRSYSPDTKSQYTTTPDDSFESILHSVLKTQASSVLLSQPNHLFWAMDLKRILPSLCVEGLVRDERFVSRATHLRYFYDSIKGETRVIRDLIESQVRNLGA
jgi:hypothetical protein